MFIVVSALMYFLQNCWVYLLCAHFNHLYNDVMIFQVVTWIIGNKQNTNLQKNKVDTVRYIRFTEKVRHNADHLATTLITMKQYTEKQRSNGSNSKSITYPVHGHIYVSTLIL